MPIKATELKRGAFLIWDGQLHQVLETEHVKPGKGPAYIQAKMKNIQTGTIKTNRINSDDRVEDATVTRREMQYLYDESGKGDGPFVFMDNNSYDQIEVSGEAVAEDQRQWLKENTECVVRMFEGKVLSVDLPASVDLRVTETTPQPRGATATNQLKDAVVETGGRVRVPPFIEVGQVVRISPDTGEYLGKA